jgi:hypothetical protein
VEEVMKKLIALFAATALVATPVAAQTAAAPEPVRAGAEMENENELRGGFIIPTVVVIGVILAILALTDTWPFDEDPESP